MAKIISRGFIRGRHAAALAVLGLVCLCALGGALGAALRYNDMVGSYRAFGEAHAQVSHVLQAAEARAHSPGPAVDSRLVTEVEALVTAMDRATAALDAADRALADLLAEALRAADFAEFVALAHAIAAPSPASAAPFDERFKTLGAIALNRLQPIFDSVDDAMAERHDILWRRSLDFAILGAGALSLALVGIALLVLRPMEHRILETQEALGRETARALAAERAQGALLAQTSHEIRTSLNGVIGIAELLARTDLAPDQARYLDVMRASGGALLRIINDVLDFSKIAAGEMSFERRRFDPSAVLNETAQVFAPGLAARGLWLRVEIAPDFPRAALGDAVRLRQAVSNLLSNAAKYTVAGGVTLRAARDPASGQALVDVIDTGAGIPPDKTEAVFESWRQLESTVADQSRGTGLGLALTRRMVERMGGRIAVESEVGRGSTFRIALPLTDAAETRPMAALRVAILSDDPALVAMLARRVEAFGCRARGVSGAIPPSDVALIDARDPEAASQAQAARGVAPEARVIALAAEGGARPRWADLALSADAPPEALRAALTLTEEDAMDSDPVSVAQAQAEALRLAAAIAAGRPPRVLVADDNDVNRMIAQTLLGHLGCLVETANDGAQAVSASQATPFDLILMDVSMPVMNGLDATRAIRAREKALGRRTPIVALTAHALDEHLGRCLDAGMDGRLVKPFRPDQLARTVAHFLAESASTERSAAG